MGELQGWFSDLPQVTWITSSSAGAQVLKERGIHKRMQPMKSMFSVCHQDLKKVRLGRTNSELRREAVALISLVVHTCKPST